MGWENDGDGDFYVGDTPPTSGPDGSSGAISTTVNTATAPIGSPEWWSQAIAEHSAGLESYTPPSSPGEPGTTQLTPAGAAALGLDPSGTYIETYSWDADIGSLIQQLPPGTIMFGALDFTFLANAILVPINQVLTPLVNTVNTILKTLAGIVVSGLTTVIEGLRSTATTVLGGLNDAGQDLSTFIGKITAPIIADIMLRVKDLREFINGLLAQAIKDVQEVLRLVHQVDNGLGDIIIGLEGMAGNMTRRFDTLDGNLKTWVPDAILEALLRALDAAVGA
jgi:hypothetical protein